MIHRTALVSILAIAASAIPALATLTTYTDQSSFIAATAGNQNFTNITFPPGPLSDPYTDLVTSTIFSATTGLSATSSPAGWPTGEVLKMTSCGGSNCPTLTITLASAVTSFDMFFGPQDFSTPSVTVDNSGGGTYFNSLLQQPNGTTPIFFGFVTTTPITTFTIQGAASVDQWTFDAVQVGTPNTPTPEAATLFLIGGGLLMLRFGRRWLPRGSSTPRPEPARAAGALCPQSAQG